VTCPHPTHPIHTARATREKGSCRLLNPAAISAGAVIPAHAGAARECAQYTIAVMAPAVPEEGGTALSPPSFFFPNASGKRASGVKTGTKNLRPTTEGSTGVHLSLPSHKYNGHS